MLTMCYVALGVCNLIGTPRKDDWSMIMEVEVENPEEKAAQNMNIKTFKCLCAIGYHGLLCAETNDGYKFPKIEEGGYLQFVFPGSGRKSVVGELEDKSSSGASESFLVGFEMKPQNFDDGQLVVYHQSEETNLRFLLTLEGNTLVFR
ncbi:unnamed protein product [Dicrocoelium dendriticum]|nr:unnamed protein product [Dicrocoelium dendriticum]